MTTRTLRLLAALLAAVLLASACGGDDDDESTTTTSAAVEDEDTTTTSDGEDPTTTTSEDTSDTTDGTDEGTDEGATGGTVDGGQMIGDLAAIDDFCSLDAYASDMDNEIFGDLGAGPPDPAQQREMRAVVEALYARAAQVAPDELREDFALVATGFGELFDVLEEYDYDSMAMFMAMENDPELAARLELLDSPEYQQASSNIDAWVEANC